MNSNSYQRLLRPCRTVAGRRAGAHEWWGAVHTIHLTHTGSHCCQVEITYNLTPLAWHFKQTRRNNNSFSLLLMLRAFNRYTVIPIQCQGRRRSQKKKTQRKLQCETFMIYIHQSLLLLLLLLLLLQQLCLLCAGSHTHIPETNHVPRGYIVAANLCCLWCLYVQFLRWFFCSFTLALSEVCVQCPIWLFSVAP